MPNDRIFGNGVEYRFEFLARSAPGSVEVQESGSVYSCVGGESVFVANDLYGFGVAYGDVIKLFQCVVGDFIVFFSIFSFSFSTLEVLSFLHDTSAAHSIMAIKIFFIGVELKVVIKIKSATAAPCVCTRGAWRSPM